MASKDSILGQWYLIEIEIPINDRSEKYVNTRAVGLSYRDKSTDTLMLHCICDFRGITMEIPIRSKEIKKMLLLTSPFLNYDKDEKMKHKIIDKKKKRKPTLKELKKLSLFTEKYGEFYCN